MLSKLARVTPADWRGLSMAYVYLLLARWQLTAHKQGLERRVMDGARPARTGPSRSGEGQTAARCARWVNIAARHPLPWARCLQRSLALCLWLERKGFQAQLRIGVRKNGAALQAHAWVEYNGRVLNDYQNVARKFTLMNASQGLTSIKKLDKAIRG